MTETKLSRITLHAIDANTNEVINGWHLQICTQLGSSVKESVDLEDLMFPTTENIERFAKRLIICILRTQTLIFAIKQLIFDVRHTLCTIFSRQVFQPVNNYQKCSKLRNVERTGRNKADLLSNSLPMIFRIAWPAIQWLDIPVIIL